VINPIEISAPSTAEAFKKVKALLGSEAVILSIDDQPGQVTLIAYGPEELVKEVPYVAEITHADATSPVTQAPPTPYVFEEGDVRFNDPIHAIRYVCDICERHQVGYDVCERWLKNLARDFGLTEFGIMHALAQTLPLSPQWLTGLEADRPLVLVGPQGGGKTVTAAKLVAMLLTAGKRVNAASLDTLKKGGIEQFEAYTRVMEVPFFTGPDAIQKLVHSQSALCVIDTPGLNILNAADRKILEAIQRLFDTPLTLVLPGDMNPADVKEVVEAYSAFGVDSLIITRLDATHHQGGYLNAATHNERVFSLFSHSPSIADGLEVFTPRSILERLQRPALRRGIQEAA
jgi:flagellar biosynthesis GTPase FlhF